MWRIPPSTSGGLRSKAQARPSSSPVNHRWHDNAVAVCTDPGTKLDVAARERRATFEVDVAVPGWREGWSVLLHGALEVVTDDDDLEALQKLPLQPWAEVDKAHHGRLRPDPVSGRTML